jgi:hypothetical protein
MTNAGESVLIRSIDVAKKAEFVQKPNAQQAIDRYWKANARTPEN